MRRDRRQRRARRRCAATAPAAVASECRTRRLGAHQPRDFGPIQRRNQPLPARLRAVIDLANTEYRLQLADATVGLSLPRQVHSRTWLLPHLAAAAPVRSHDSSVRNPVEWSTCGNPPCNVEGNFNLHSSQFHSSRRRRTNAGSSTGTSRSAAPSSRCLHRALAFSAWMRAGRTFRLLGPIASNSLSSPAAARRTTDFEWTKRSSERRGGGEMPGSPGDPVVRLALVMLELDFYSAFSSDATLLPRLGESHSPRKSKTPVGAGHVRVLCRTKASRLRAWMRLRLITSDMGCWQCQMTGCN